jgi:hypothetical protein
MCVNSRNSKRWEQKKQGFNIRNNILYQMVTREYIIIPNGLDKLLT